MLTIVAITLFAGKMIMDYANSYRQKIYVERMLSEASQYMENGKHTKASLNVISGYINGQFIAGETEEDFIYEIAKAYFLDVRDYYLSLRYFRRLDLNDAGVNEKYPDAHFYIELCELLTDFYRDKDSVNEVLERFDEFNKLINDMDEKKENERVIELLRMEYGI